jgi:hypothetical protein
VRRRLVGEDVRRDVARDQLGQDVGRIRGDRNRACLAARAARVGTRERRVERGRRLVQVLRREPAFDARRIDLDDERDAVIHRDGQRLGATHPAQAGGDGERTAQGAAEMAAGHGGERLVGALQNALSTDVNPRSGGHLAVHREAAILEIAKVGPRGPGGHEQRVGDDDARGPLMRPEHGDGLARLDDQRFVGAERRQRPTMPSNAAQLRAALPVPPYTTRSSGRSATSGSRLFMSIRNAASCGHP